MKNAKKRIFIVAKPEYYRINKDGNTKYISKWVWTPRSGLIVHFDSLRMITSDYSIEELLKSGEAKEIT